MKKLSIEQKAERYDDVVSKLKSFMAQGVDPLITRADVQDFFPELKESEGDRIRRALIEHIKGIYKGCCTEEAGKERDMFLAWLEEQGNLVKYYEDKLDRCACSNFNKGYKKALEIQGKQKPTDKVNQKFKVGDWITNGTANPAQISSIKNGVYFTHNDTIGGDIESIDKQYHLWTIKDAKDGDVLASKDGDDILIFRRLDTTEGFSSYYDLRGQGELGWTSKNFIPATKEQCDLLFKKMHEASYEWNAEKKELKKIEQKHTPKHKVGDTIYYNSFGEVKSMIVTNVVTDSTDNPMYEDENGSAVFEKDLIEQKPTWSEEDENIKQSIIGILTRQGFQTQVNWLKDRIQPQSKQEWNKEEQQIIKDAACLILSCVNTAETKEEEERLEELADKLQDLRPQSK